MEISLKNNNLLFLVKQYELLKEEQLKRIKYRDHMIYLTLGALGAVFSFVFEKTEYINVLLILPFACIVLGWTYLVNDQKVTEIGNFLRNTLIPKIEQLCEPSPDLNPTWEVYHRSDKRRKERKLIQLIIDLAVFCFSAIFSIIAFFYYTPDYSNFHLLICIGESLFILYLVYQFIIYSAIGEK